MQTMIIQHNGLVLSSLPTECHQQLIHVRINSLLQQNLQQQEKLYLNFKHSFQKTSSKTHIKAYVDPSQLSYNSFQNILNLDQCYFGPKCSENNYLKLSILNVQKLDNYYTFSIDDPENLLIELHQMDLYTLPFNNLSRGGKRMIFSSQILADVLKNQLQSSQFSVHNNFHQGLNSVNHVFRLNCFSPTNENFKTHYDTPFSDNNRKLYSKYTLLIYLTGGSNPQNGCLKIDQEKIKEIPAMTGVIFDQRYQHQGWPYVEGDKIFLRTELIYHIKDVDNDQRVAQMFNQACYFHKQSLCNSQNPLYSEELQKYSNQLFNHTAKLRYTLAQKKQQLYLQQLQKYTKNNQYYEKIALQVEEKYLLKKNLQVMYITNGNSFWFMDDFPLKLLAKLVLVDYFNGKMRQLSEKQVKESKKMKINSKPLKIKLDTNDQIQEENPTQHSSKVDQQILTLLDSLSFPDEENQIQYPYTFQEIVDTGTKSYNIKQSYCPLCDPQDRITSDDYELQAKQLSLQRLHTKMSGVGVILFHGKVHVNDDCIEIDEVKRQISFNNAFLNHSINFASCQCQAFRKEQVIAKQTVQVEGFLLPKINYEALKPLKGYKLSIDMFKNGFIHRIKSTISRPYAINPSKSSPQNYFYDRNDRYIDSDNDFDGYSKDRNQESELDNRFLYEMRQRRKRNIRNSRNN